MDAPLPNRRKLDLHTTAGDLQPSSQDTGSAEPGDENPTKICESTCRAHSPSHHSQRRTRDAKGQHKSPNVYDNSRSEDILSEEQENGKVILGNGSEEQEGALRALESYAAFQAALLRHLTDDSTFNEHPKQTLFSDAVVQSGPLSEPCMLHSACGTHLDRPPKTMGRTNSRPFVMTASRLEQVAAEET